LAKLIGNPTAGSTVATIGLVTLTLREEVAAVTVTLLLLRSFKAIELRTLTPVVGLVTVIEPETPTVLEMLTAVVGLVMLTAVIGFNTVILPEIAAVLEMFTAVVGLVIVTELTGLRTVMLPEMAAVLVI